METSDFHLDAHKNHKRHKKHKKVQNVKQAIFFLLDVFYANENAVFFVFTHKKAQKGTKYIKSTKSTKTQISE